MKYIDADKLKGEIERRIELHDSLASNAESEMIANLEIGAAQALDDLRSFLNTLESEKPRDPETAMKELDEKIALVKQKGTWDGVDVDKYMDEVRGREPEKPMNQDELEKAIGSYMSNKWKFGCVTPITPVVLPNFTTEDLKDVARHFAQWQKEQDTREMIMSDVSYFQKCYELGKKDMKDYPKWRRIKAGERLPCPAYVWTIAYDNYPDCFEGRLMPNIEGVKVGRDTWYLPVDVIHNLPKEDKS